MFYLFTVESFLDEDESFEVFVKAYDEYEAEARFNELFPFRLYCGYLEDEYTEEEAKILGFDVY
jgi:hypothetical protein